MQLISGHERDLTPVQQQALMNAIDSIGFWTIPGSTNSGAEDATLMIIEGRNARSYRLVANLGGDDSKLILLGRDFLREAALPIPQGMAERLNTPRSY